MIKILIRSDAVDTREGNSKATGKAYRMRTQTGALDNGSDFPHPIRVPLEEAQPPYPAGEYTLADDAYKVGEYGDPQISRFYKLVRIAPAASNKAA